MIVGILEDGKKRAMNYVTMNYVKKQQMPLEIICLINSGSY